MTIVAILERATLYFVGAVDVENSQDVVQHVRFDPKKHTQTEVLDTLDFQIEALGRIVLPSGDKVTVGFEYQYVESDQGESVSKLFVTDIMKLIIIDIEIQTCFPLMNTTGPRSIVLNRCIQGINNAKAYYYQGLPNFLKQKYVQWRVGMEVCTMPIGKMYQLQSQLVIPNPLKILDEIPASHEDTAQTRTVRQRRKSFQEVPWMGSLMPKKPLCQRTQYSQRCSRSTP